MRAKTFEETTQAVEIAGATSSQQQKTTTVNYRWDYLCFSLSVRILTLVLKDGTDVEWPSKAGVGQLFDWRDRGCRSQPNPSATSGHPLTFIWSKTGKKVLPRDTTTQQWHSSDAHSERGTKQSSNCQPFHCWRSSFLWGTAALSSEPLLLQKRVDSRNSKTAVYKSFKTKLNTFEG